MSFIAWLEDHMLRCPYQEHFGISCLGCGMQRSFIALLKGDVMGSIMLYPALLPLIGMFLFLLLHVYFKFKYGAVILKWLFVFNIALTLLNRLVLS